MAKLLTSDELTEMLSDRWVHADVYCAGHENARDCPTRGIAYLELRLDGGEHLCLQMTNGNSPFMAWVKGRS